MYIFEDSKVDAYQVDINEQACQMPTIGNIDAFARFKRVILKGLWMLCASINIESMREKTVYKDKWAWSNWGVIEPYGLAWWNWY